MVTIAYAIGQRRPEMVTAVTDWGLGVASWVHEHFPDLSLGATIERLGLRKPRGWSYNQTAAYGHYGRSGFHWEAVCSLPKTQSIPDIMFREFERSMSFCRTVSRPIALECSFPGVRVLGEVARCH